VGRSWLVRWLPWVVIWVGWSVATRAAHSSTALAWTCTGILVVTWALLFELYRRRWSRGPWRRGLGLTALALVPATVAAVALILLCYGPLLGPYPARPWSENVALDYVGGVVHVGAAAAVLAWRRRSRRPAA
jgi:hypothetical protein